MVLSGGDLIATNTTDSQSGAVCGNARSSRSFSSGKPYVEFTGTDPYGEELEDLSFGFCDGTFDATRSVSPWDSWSVNVFFGQNSNGTGTDPNNASYTLLMPNGSTCGLAIDIPAGKAWMCDSEGTYGTGDPAAGTGPMFTFTPGTPVYFFCASFGRDAGHPAPITLNAGASAFVHGAPSGFTAANSL